MGKPELHASRTKSAFKLAAISYGRAHWEIDENYPNHLHKDFQHDLLRSQSRVSSSARYKCHDPINQEYSLRDHEPHHRNFRPQQIEESDNDINREDLTTLPKPEIDVAKNKPHVDVQARNYTSPNRSEITTIISGEASEAPSPSFRAVRSEQLADRVVQERLQKEIRQTNINEVTGSTPKPQDQEVHVSIEENKSVSVSPVSSCVEVNSIRVCPINKVPVLTQHDVFPRSIDSSKGHTCSNVSSVEEGTNFQDNNSKVVSQCYVAQRFEDNSVISSQEIQVFPAEASMCVSPEFRPCITEPVIHVSKPNVQESVVFYTVETELTDAEVVQSPYTFIEPVVLCRKLHVETATSCVLDSTFHTCHSPEPAVNRSVNVNASHPSRTHRESRSVSENPGVSQVKLGRFLLRILCSYYGKDTLNKNLLAKNSHVEQTIGVSIPSVQMADLRKEDQDPTKFTQGNVPVCSDVNEDHLLCPEVKVDYLNDVYEVNDRFIALVSHDTLPLSRDTNNVSINGSVCDTELTFLVDTGANVTARYLATDICRYLQIFGDRFHPRLNILHLKRRLVTLSRLAESRFQC